MEERENKHEVTKSTRRDNLLFNEPKSNLYYKCQLITERWLIRIHIFSPGNERLDVLEGKRDENTCFEGTKCER